MGYITTYELQVLEGDPGLIQQFREECDNAEYALQSDGYCNESCKWYDSDDDMRAFSLKHPEALFQLDGDGESSDDKWRQYWRNGKVQDIQAQIVYDEFDETKMK
jgi:hypothetical protein